MLLETSIGHGNLPHNPFPDTLNSMATDYYRPVEGVSGMGFYLSGPLGYSGRFVKGSTGPMAEGWSPNVDRIVAFPGNYDFEDKRSLASYTGKIGTSNCHLGPCDLTISPQPYQPLHPYWGFILHHADPTYSAEWTSPERIWNGTGIPNMWLRAMMCRRDELSKEVDGFRASEIKKKSQGFPTLQRPYLPDDSILRA